MVAEHGEAAAANEIHDHRDRPLRIRAVTDIVAEKYVVLCTMLPRLPQTGVERLSVGVNVGEYRNQHRKAPLFVGWSKDAGER